MSYYQSVSLSLISGGLLAFYSIGLSIFLPAQATPLEAQTVQFEQIREPVPLSLEIADVVQLVVENNTEVKNAYLDRIAQRQDLAVAEDKFKPNLTPRILLNARRGSTGPIITQSEGLDIGASLNTQFPIGTEITLDWRTVRRLERQLGSTTPLDQRALNHQVELQLRQPLLRRSGVEVNQASVERARLTNRVQILQVKSTLIDRVTDSILRYRTLFQRQQQLEIAELTLANSRRRLEVTEALIEAGKLPPVERIQGAADVANQELSVLNAKNALDEARLDLLNLLELDQDLAIAAQAPTLQDQPILEAEQLVSIAIENNPTYLQAKLTQKIANYTLIEAADDRRWDLDLEADYNFQPSNLVETRSDLTLGLTLSKTWGDLQPEQRFQQSQVNVTKAENTLSQIYSSLNIDLNNLIREIQLTWKEVQQSRSRTQLVAEQLAAEEEKLSLGLDNTSLTDIINFQNQLAQAQQNELGVLIEYLNALTQLDRSLGITLKQWNLNLEIE
ncbi:MAG: TolC family protein [Roseofilum sp. SBFL]|uniref:TolC family protein n=1 Tax=unclassified Roseofilum TaxID=2620099 RepID=UPI001B2152E1|nr:MULTISPECIES: TolC family protein [unclassified Roseofilum]MBP0011524.1 TolC family protein [Roseofilum sp. SID3]MBP0025703.1 TolC family protein [Roseofilum sp. SID2]MBP0038462.1 TolC family protein [Roseofilum sp. SID1]MBP0043225.1 TolC family protein [Roseofilum sp. SBFL]